MVPAVVGSSPIAHPIKSITYSTLKIAYEQFLPIYEQFYFTASTFRTLLDLK